MLVTIVTICFNNLDELIDTCSSIDTQSVTPYEHWIIDGSTNKDIYHYLETNPQPEYRKWLCELDEGIADAFNKGIQRATGDVILLLNSGDTLYDKTVLQDVTIAFKIQPDAKWLHGKLYTLRGDLWVTVGKPFDFAKLYRGMRGVFHPTMFVKTELYKKHGLYNKQLKMAMDYDFLCRIGKEPFIFLDRTISRFDSKGISSTRYLDAMKEANRVYRSHYGYTLMQTIWTWRLTLLHVLLQSPVGKFLYRIKVALGLANA